MSLVAASSNCLRVASLRSAWVRRGAYWGSAELSRRDRSFWRGAGAESFPDLGGATRPGSLEFDIDAFFDDFNWEGLQRHRARHAGGLAVRDVKGAEMPGAFHDLPGQHA